MELGGEVAADRLTGQLKPARVTLYVWGAPVDLILANRLRPDERGAVEFLEAFWRPIEDGDAARQTAPPLFVYADLTATGDPRNLEDQVLRQAVLLDETTVQVRTRELLTGFWSELTAAAAVA